MQAELWELDRNGLCTKAREYLARIENAPHPKYKVGQRISFWTGYNDDIRAAATIKAIDAQGGIYVYSDSYWYPIKDDEKRAIKIEG